MAVQPELLSPAGSLEAFYGAIKSGCDAVYFGGKSFSARSYASNFTLEEMKEAVAYAKPRGIKCYLTLNTLVKNEEMGEVFDYLKEISHIGIDACIIQDIGLAKVIKAYFPSMEIHGSTQMTVHSLEGVLYLKDLGFSRIVLSRELTLREIKEIVSKSGIEIECFIHGALCYSYSGQCLMSSYIGGRSGNRGRCAQPCRLPYNIEKDDEKQYKKSKYLMSLKDMNTLELIPMLMEAGIHSFKIEGRMKRVEYVAGVTAIYRKYMNQYQTHGKINIIESDQENLKQLFNRGEFSKGYYLDKHDMIYDKNPKNAGVKVGKVVSINGKRIAIKVDKAIHMGDGIEILTDQQPHPGFQSKQNVNVGQILSININGAVKKGHEVYRTRDQQLLNSIQESIKKADRKKIIHAKVIAKIGLPFTICFYNDQDEVTVQGDIVEHAKGSPVTEERLTKQIKKLGNTPFQIGKLDLEMDDNIFVSIAMINESRRSGITKLLEKSIAKPENHDIKPLKEIGRQEVIDHKQLTVSVQNEEQYRNALKNRWVDRIYLEEIAMSMDKLVQLLTLPKEGKEIYIALPYISRNNGFESFKAYEKLNIDGYLLRTYGQFKWVKEHSSKNYVLDYNFNIMNNYAIKHWKNENVMAMTISTELSYKELLKVRDNQLLEYIGYGYLPMMVTEQCLIKDAGHCKQKQSSDFKLIDRKNNKFKILRNCRDCNSIIYNTHPLFLLKNGVQLNNLPIKSLRLIFIDEEIDLMDRIIKGYRDVLDNYKSVDTELFAVFDHKGFTRGHLLRGVE